MRVSRISLLITYLWISLISKPTAERHSAKGVVAVRGYEGGQSGGGQLTLFILSKIYYQV